MTYYLAYLALATFGLAIVGLRSLPMANNWHRAALVVGIICPPLALLWYVGMIGAFVVAHTFGPDR